MSDRKEFQPARDAFKAKHHEQRLENATYTAAEVKALTKTAADLAYALGRKEAGERIARICELAGKTAQPESPQSAAFLTSARIARDIGTKGDPT